jgi:glycosyltransferase 2 family protein
LRLYDLEIHIEKQDLSYYTETVLFSSIGESVLNTRKWIFRGITATIAIILIVIVLIQIDWQAFQQYASRLSLVSILGAFLTYVAQNYFRAWRYRALLNAPEIPMSQLFPISLYHNFLVRLLPFKLGEATYVILLNQRLKYSYKAGVSSLFASRLLELLVIVLVAVIGLLVFGTVIPEQSPVLIVMLIVSVIGGIAGLYFSGAILHRCVKLSQRMISWKALTPFFSKLDSFATELDQLRDPKRFGGGFFWSFFTYGSTFATSAILLNALGVQLSFDKFVIVISLGMFASAFPFNFSGFGMVEMSLAVGLSQLGGFGIGEATAIGLVLNGFQQLSAVVSGILGWVALQYLPPLA